MSAVIVNHYSNLLVVTAAFIALMEQSSARRFKKVVAVVLSQAEALSHAEAHTNGEYYEQRQLSRDVIGKVYMGREIFHVMGHLGAG